MTGIVGLLTPWVKKNKIVIFSTGGQSASLKTNGTLQSASIFKLFRQPL